MVKITRRVVEAAEAQEKDYLIWDDELPGFGLRVFCSGKRSYVIQYRTKGRSRRYTIGLHGARGPETARREAEVQLGRVAGGDDPVEDRQLDHKAITVKQLCTRYFADLQAVLILGKRGRPKKPSTISSCWKIMHGDIASNRSMFASLTSKLSSTFWASSGYSAA
jgi:hypothetical protein